MNRSGGQSGPHLPFVFWIRLLVLGLCASGCTQVEQSPVRPESSKPRPDQEIWGWTAELTQGGRKRAVVKAGHFQKYDRSPNTELDEGVTVIFYDSHGQRQVSELTARRAEIDGKTNDMMVFDLVVLIAQDSTRLETDSLSWHRESEKITGQGRVRIRRSDGVETGVGFEASSDLKRWTMHQVITRLGRADPLGP